MRHAANNDSLKKKQKKYFPFFAAKIYNVYFCKSRKFSLWQTRNSIIVISKYFRIFNKQSCWTLFVTSNLMFRFNLKADFRDEILNIWRIFERSWKLVELLVWKQKLLEILVWKRKKIVFLKQKDFIWKKIFAYLQN